MRPRRGGFSVVSGMDSRQRASSGVGLRLDWGVRSPRVASVLRTITIFQGFACVYCLKQQLRTVHMVILTPAL